MDDPVLMYNQLKLNEYVQQHFTSLAYVIHYIYTFNFSFTYIHIFGIWLTWFSSLSWSTL